MSISVERQKIFSPDHRNHFVLKKNEWMSSESLIIIIIKGCC